MKRQSAEAWVNATPGRKVFAVLAIAVFGGLIGVCWHSLVALVYQ